jgi:hypothetical protein
VDFGDLREQTQPRLIEFLNLELDLASTYIKMAETRENGRERLLRNARTALEAVRRFEKRIAYAKTWAAIHERADELKQLLSTFKT